MTTNLSNVAPSNERGLGEPRVKEALPSAGASSNGFGLGEIKWFGGFNSKTGAENAYGFISASNQDVYFHRSQTSSPPESLIAGAKVVFRPSIDRRGKAAASSVRVLSDISDAELVALLKETNDFSAEFRVTIACARGVISPCENEVLQAVSALSRVVPSPRTLKLFWEKFPPSGPHDSFFGLAPTSVKSMVCSQYYSLCLSILRNLFSSVNKATSSLTAEAAYGELTEEDRKLADYWAKGQPEGALAKMLSARTAEKTAAKIYESVQGIVQDVSITQLDGGTGDWTTHDLLLNSSIPIDVKNARRPIHSNRFYVDHTVPRFKLDRRGTHVRIAGILSPYLNIKYINDPKSAKFRIDDLIYIGETSRDDIDRISSKFSSVNFEIIRSHERTLPSWAFGYPTYWYREFLTSVSQAKNDCEWPDGDEWSYVLDTAERLGSVPALCVMGKPLPAVVSSQLLDWQVQFYSTLQSTVGSPPSLPSVFFAVLTDFLAALSNDRVGFTPEGYRPLLFSRDHCIHPLGAIDPLCLVQNLVNTLTTLWDHRSQYNLERFSSFRFGGLGILQGRENHHREWTTIIAYCGGTVYEVDESGVVITKPDGQPQSPKGKCGHTPVVIGKNPSCPSCRRLICNKCGFCSPVCRERKFQALADEEDKAATAKGRLNSIQIDVGHEMPDWESVPLEAYENDLRRR